MGSSSYTPVLDGFTGKDMLTDSAKCGMFLTDN